MNEKLLIAVLYIATLGICIVGLEILKKLFSYIKNPDTRIRSFTLSGLAVLDVVLILDIYYRGKGFKAADYFFLAFVNITFIGIAIFGTSKYFKVKTDEAAKKKKT